MSYFVHVCNLSDLEVSPHAGVQCALRADAPSLLLSSRTGSALRASEAEGVYAETATAAELADNSGKGADFRFEVVVVQSEPPAFAIFTQAQGEVRWLSFNPAAPTVAFAAEVGPNEQFTITNLGTSSGYRTILSKAHGQYLSLCAEGGAVCIKGTTVDAERAAFWFDASLGTGPLMPSRSYFVKTVLGTMVTPAGDAAAQTYAHGRSEEFYVEACDGGQRSPAGVQCYRFRAYDGRYLIVKPVAGAPYGEVSFGTHKAASECSFYLSSDYFVLGSFKLIHSDTLLVVSADARTNGMGVSLPMARNTCDCLSFQAVTTGRVEGLGKRVGPVVKCPMNRSHPSLKRMQDRLAAGAAKKAARQAAANTILPAAFRLPSCPFPFASVRPPVTPVEVMDEGMFAGKGAVEEEQRVAVVTGRWSAKKWALLAAIAAFIVALLIAAQIVVSRNGGRVPFW